MCNQNTTQIDAATARKIFQEQNWYCHYCKTVMLDCATLPTKTSLAMADLATSLGIQPYSARWIGKVRQHCATIDHIIPQKKGGTNDPKNIVGACGYCNSYKSDMNYEQAREKLAKMVKESKHPCMS